MKKFSLILGVLLIIFGVICILSWSQVFKLLVIQQLVINPTSPSFSDWKKPNVDLNLDIYFFNWTNSDDFEYRKSSQIQLQEIGPFSFIERLEKVDVNFNDNSTVSYKTKSHYSHKPGNISLDEILHSIDIASAGAVYNAKDLDENDTKLVDTGLTSYDKKISIKKTAKEFLIEGYEDDMMGMAKIAVKDGYDFIPNMPSDIPDRIGWFYERNTSSSGTYNVDTGENDYQFGKILKFKFKDEFGDEKNCKKSVHGSTDFFYSSEMKSSIELFVADMCSTLKFEFDKYEEVSGVNGIRYELKKLQNVSSFCSIFPEFIDIESCRPGSPVYISLPHFMNVGENFNSFKSKLEGLNPDEDKHSSYIVIDEILGVPIAVSIKLQINVLIQKDEKIELFAHLPHDQILVPILCFEQSYELNDDMKMKLKAVPYVYLTLKYFFIIIGCILIILGLILSIKYSFK